MSKKYEISVLGTVERTVFVEADSLESAERAAEARWSGLTGGIKETAEIVSAVEIET
tara:strand:+ start:1114 stop:1284 length:171 start_codon:yes stop_codon:yes gene_type:complete